MFLALGEISYTIKESGWKFFVFNILKVFPFFTGLSGTHKRTLGGTVGAEFVLNALCRIIPFFVIILHMRIFISCGDYEIPHACENVSTKKKKIIRKCLVCVFFVFRFSMFLSYHIDVLSFIQLLLYTWFEFLFFPFVH